MNLKYVGIFAVAMAALTARAADPAASQPQKTPSLELTPAVRAAIKELSAEDFAIREKAMADVEAALGQEMRAIVGVNDPEAQARVNDVLIFEQGLCEWIKEVLKEPEERQKDAFDFGLQAEVLPHVAHLYAKEANLRLDAVKALREMKDPRVMDLLARAIGDREQVVYLAAMEGVYDRPPTDAVVEALWRRAVAAQMATFHQQQVQPVPPRMSFLGKSIQALNNGDNELYLQSQNNAEATEVLVHLKPAQVLPKLNALFAEAETAYAPRNGNQQSANAYMYLPSQELMRNAIRIASVYKSQELVAGLYRIATGPVFQQSAGALPRGGTYYWSNRTWAIALVLEFTGQSPTDWDLRTVSQIQGMWAMPTERDELAATQKLRDWWQAEHDKYGSGVDTRPVPADPVPAPGPGPIGKPVPFLPMAR